MSPLRRHYKHRLWASRLCSRRRPLPWPPTIRARSGRGPPSRPASSRSCRTWFRRGRQHHGRHDQLCLRPACAGAWPQAVGKCAARAGVVAGPSAVWCFGAAAALCGKLIGPLRQTYMPPFPARSSNAVVRLRIERSMCSLYLFGQSRDVIFPASCSGVTCAVTVNVVPAPASAGLNS